VRCLESPRGCWARDKEDVVPKRDSGAHLSLLLNRLKGSQLPAQLNQYVIGNREGFRPFRDGFFGDSSEGLLDRAPINGLGPPHLEPISRKD
jgi:hypothetical protein